jgi:hypothetical protein
MEIPQRRHRHQGRTVGHRCTVRCVEHPSGELSRHLTDPLDVHKLAPAATYPTDDADFLAEQRVPAITHA